MLFQNTDEMLLRCNCAIIIRRIDEEWSHDNRLYIDMNSSKK